MLTQQPIRFSFYFIRDAASSPCLHRLDAQSMIPYDTIKLLPLFIETQQQEPIEPGY